MRSPLCAVLLILSVAGAYAERNKLQPADFQPLTSLPWKKPGATTPEVLDRIFREPDRNIRYPILAEYLRIVPEAEFGLAFDLCLKLEGTQSPNDLVEFLLPIWARRDPVACWTRTQQLFQIVGIENGWLGYDGWKKRPRITVQDPAAIQNSPYWLESRALSSFAAAVDQSPVAKEARVGILKEFAERWIEAFGSWPGYIGQEAVAHYSEGYHERSDALLAALERPTHELSQCANPDSVSGDREAFEMVLRRWLEATPAAAPKVLQRAQNTSWSPTSPGTAPTPSRPSVELLAVWARTDLAGMIRWAETTDVKKDKAVDQVRGFLMSRVDDKTRDRWLVAAKSRKPADNFYAELLYAWAAWAPEAALPSVIATHKAEMIGEVAKAVVFGPWDDSVWNTHHSGLGIIQSFDISTIPAEIRRDATADWSQDVMEMWGSVDIGETARYGVAFLWAYYSDLRPGLLKFFSGEDVFPNDSGMIDRTFCALRVWAVVRPEEMKLWIASLEDAELGQSLTWLLQNPWGSGPAEEPRESAN